MHRLMRRAATDSCQSDKLLPWPTGGDGQAVAWLGLMPFKRNLHKSSDERYVLILLEEVHKVPDKRRCQQKGDGPDARDT